MDSDGWLEHSESPWMQKILGSASMGGISGPFVSVGNHQNVDTCLAHCHRADTNCLLLLNVTLLTQLIQSSILFDDLGTSTNETSISNLVSPPSRAVIVRDEDGVSIHSTEDEDKLARVLLLCDISPCRYSSAYYFSLLASCLIPYFLGVE